MMRHREGGWEKKIARIPVWEPVNPPLPPGFPKPGMRWERKDNPPLTTRMWEIWHENHERGRSPF